MDERIESFASCFTLTNMMIAARKCYTGVDWKYQPQSFMARLITNCGKLFDELREGTYRPMPVQKFGLNERGKAREVKPVNYRDRVVQRCLCEHILIPAMHSTIVEDNSACLKGRGLSYAFDRVKMHAENTPREGWIGQFDFSGYFASIDQEILLDQLASLIDDSRSLWLLETIIREDEGGLELGSHVSQLCATLYPDSLDKAMCASPGVVGYHRYMDDGIVFGEDKQSIVKALETLEERVESLHLKLNSKKTHIQPIREPFVFCKMRFTKLEDGSVRKNVRKQQTKRSVKHAKAVKRLAEQNPHLEIDLVPVRAALIGYVNRGDVDLTRLTEGI